MSFNLTGTCTMREITKFQMTRIRRVSVCKHVDTTVQTVGVDDIGQHQGDGGHQQWFVFEQPRCGGPHQDTGLFSHSRTVLTTSKYCTSQRMKIKIGTPCGANGTWSSEDNVKMKEVVDSGLTIGPNILKEIVKQLGPGHGYDVTKKRCQRDRSTTLTFIQVEWKRNSDLCLWTTPNDWIWTIAGRFAGDDVKFKDTCRGRRITGTSGGVKEKVFFMFVNNT